jgi:membrane-associated protease RseP (regulator of RpoE activity)
MSSAGLGISLFVLSLILVIVIHEAGHFTFAKIFGMKVEEFFLGFGARLWSTRRGETEYGVKAIPLGGYVRIAGMNPFQETAPADLPRTYGAKPAWQRFLVVLAGPITHFAMAFLVLAIYFAVVGTPRYAPVVGTVEATLRNTAGVSAASPAAAAGLRAGDVIVRVGTVDRPDQDAFVAYTRSHVGRPVDLTVRRGDRSFHVTVTPVLSPIPGDGPRGRIGIDLGSGAVLSRDRANPVVALGRSAATIERLSVQLFRSLGAVFGPAAIGRIVHLLGGAPRTVADPSGLVGGARLAGEAAQAGSWDTLFLLFAEFNIFVGLLNLIPLPPLDGGHLAVVVYEKATRRRVDPQKLIPVAAVVLSFFVLLTVSLLYLDIVNPVPNPFR